MIKSAVHQDAVRASFDLSLKLAEPEANTLITTATLDWETLPAAEQSRFHNYASALFSYFEALFYAQRAGNVDQEIWHSRVLRMRAMFVFDAFVSAWNERKVGFGNAR